MISCLYYIYPVYHLLHQIPKQHPGVAWVFGGVSDIQGRYSTGMKSSKMQTGENALLITFAQRFLPWLSIGANFKILRYDLPITESDQVSGSGIGFDIGIIVKTGLNNYSYIESNA